jgi:hypothetical protein
VDTEEVINLNLHVLHFSTPTRPLRQLSQHEIVFSYEVEGLHRNLYR